MFVRAELKKQAKAIMKDKYFHMLLVCLIASFLTVSVMDVTIDVETESAVLTLFYRLTMSVDYERAVLMAFPTFVVGILWALFVVNPATIGINLLTSGNITFLPTNDVYLSSDGFTATAVSPRIVSGLVVATSI